MKRTFFIPMAAAASVISSPSICQPEQTRPPAPIVYFDVAGPDTAKQQDFYSAVFGWTAGPGGTVSVPVSGSRLPGTLRTDPAAKIIYLGVTNIVETQKQIVAHGGKVITPRFEVKGVAVLGLFTDPAGNSMGLVELTPDNKTKVP